ncbi:unnamed protein product [Angiostrongylus costaricensis]|uniref:30S ribosomal protein S17 n=1 Tax=Angiostrongylus costaricensis TaxID=334426 RepID=A0A0R3Q0A3_ANGCS|nr:unnamed protein product [Angiostrongylus costaricensis]
MDVVDLPAIFPKATRRKLIEHSAPVCKKCDTRTERVKIDDVVSRTGIVRLVSTTGRNERKRTDGSEIESKQVIKIE